jgi:hypothetical protein
LCRLVKKDDTKNRSPFFISVEIIDRHYKKNLCVTTNHFSSSGCRWRSDLPIPQRSSDSVEDQTECAEWWGPEVAVVGQAARHPCEFSLEQELDDRGNLATPLMRGAGPTMTGVGAARLQSRLQEGVLGRAPGGSAIGSGTSSRGP